MDCDVRDRFLGPSVAELVELVHVRFRGFTDAGEGGQYVLVSHGRSVGRPGEAEDPEGFLEVRMLGGERVVLDRVEGGA